MSDLAYRYGMPGRTNRLVAGVLVGALLLSAAGFLSWTVLFHGDPEAVPRMGPCHLRRPACG